MTAPKPEPTLEMQLKALEWAWIDDAWKVVCSTCKGNCGQCGLTGIVANVEASMDALAAAIRGES